MAGFKEKLECGKVVFEAFFFKTAGDFKAGFDKKDTNTTDASRMRVRTGTIRRKAVLTLLEYDEGNIRSNHRV